MSIKNALALLAALGLTACVEPGQSPNDQAATQQLMTDFQNGCLATNGNASKARAYFIRSGMTDVETVRNATFLVTPDGTRSAVLERLAAAGVDGKECRVAHDDVSPRSLVAAQERLAAARFQGRNVTVIVDDDYIVYGFAAGLSNGRKETIEAYVVENSDTFVEGGALSYFVGRVEIEIIEEYGQ